MSNFYTHAFGWQTKQLGPEIGEYVVATTSESDKDGRPIKPGIINGGFYQKTDDKSSQCPCVVIWVDDINEHTNKVQQVGGEVIGKTMDIPGVGRYVSFFDTEGNRLGMLQPPRK